MPTPEKEWTIVVLSENQAQMRQFRLKRFWFYGALTVGISALSLLLIFGYMTWSLSSQVEDNTALKAKVKELEATNDRIRDIAERLAELKQFEQQLRRGLLMPEEGLPSDEALAADSGFFYQNTEDPSQESRLLDIYAERQVDFSAEYVLPSDIPTHPPVRGYVTRSFESKHSLTDPGHYGLDVAAKVGTPILAAANGLVLFSGWSYPYGNLIVVAHKSGYDTFYGHNQILLVEPGERVLQGQPIALLGNSGRSSAPHLHFEIWKDGARVDPETVLSHEAG